MPPQAILSHLHKISWPELRIGVRTVLTSASFLWHCRFLFEAERELEILMLKAEWGVKRTCLGCGARFYDLKRDPIVCPKCDTEFVVAPVPKPRRVRPVAAVKVAAKVAAKETDALIDDSDVDAAADVEVNVDDDTASDDAVLDTDTDDDDGDVIVAKGADDDDDGKSIEEDVLLDDAAADATDDDATDDAAAADVDDTGEDEDPGDAKTAKAAKTGDGKPKTG